MPKMYRVIYRDTGEGIYTGGSLGWDCSHNCSDACPPPDSDVLLCTPWQERQHLVEYLFGFSSLLQLERWFSRRWNDTREDLCVLVFDLPEGGDYIIGEKQMVADIDLMMDSPVVEMLNFETLEPIGSEGIVW